MKRAKKVLRFLLLIVICFIFAACSYFGNQSSSPVLPEDIVGTWQADFSQYSVFDLHSIELVTGTETISFEQDGRYRQFWNNETVATGAWKLKDGPALHLTDARILTSGPQIAEYYAEGRMISNMLDCQGHEIEIDGSVLILCIMASREDSGGINLQHLSVGDPDSPVDIEFYRVETNPIH